jgi:Co/Zn/Cd efflux system component
LTIVYLLYDKNGDAEVACVLLITLGLSLVMMLLKLATGLETGSPRLIADAGKTSL